VKVYLAGPINGCSDEECVYWRERAKTMLPEHECIDPMRRDYRGTETNAYVRLVHQDKEDIDRCDVLLVHYTRPSVGTAMEILYAWERNKFVILVHTTGQPLSPWLLYHKHSQFDTLEAAAAYINDRLSSVAKHAAAG
jgi:nucleoside 2-deoxyribosyltransferase